jgi:hypothetical protein
LEKFHGASEKFKTQSRLKSNITNSATSIIAYELAHNLSQYLKEKHLIKVHCQSA